MPAKRADQHADGEAGHADARGQQNAAENDHHVVEHRRERGNDELSLGILHGAQDAALVKAELRGQHEAREEDDLALFLRSESRGDRRRELRGKDFAEDDQADQQEPHEGHDRGENPPGFVLAILGGVLGEDGNEGDAERGAGDQIIEEIGQGEGGVIGVGHGVRADLVGDGPLAKEAEDAGEQDSAHDDGRRGEDAAVNAGLRHVRHGRGFVVVRLESWEMRESKLYRCRGAWMWGPRQGCLRVPVFSRRTSADNFYLR